MYKEINKLWTFTWICGLLHIETVCPLVEVFWRRCLRCFYAPNLIWSLYNASDVELEVLSVEFVLVVVSMWCNSILFCHRFFSGWRRMRFSTYTRRSAVWGTNYSSSTRYWLFLCVCLFRCMGVCHLFLWYQCMASLCNLLQYKETDIAGSPKSIRNVKQVPWTLCLSPPSSTSVLMCTPSRRSGPPAIGIRRCTRSWLEWRAGASGRSTAWRSTWSWPWLLCRRGRNWATAWSTETPAPGALLRDTERGRHRMIQERWMNERRGGGREGCCEIGWERESCKMSLHRVCLSVFYV